MRCVSIHDAHARLDCGQHDAICLCTPALDICAFLVILVVSSSNVMPLYCACHGES